MCPETGVGCRSEAARSSYLRTRLPGRGKPRPVWRAKYRLPDGRQVQRTIGKVWTERGRPPEGYFTKRMAEAWLRDVLAQAERGTLPGMVHTGRPFANAADEYLRYLAEDRQRTGRSGRRCRA